MIENRRREDYSICYGYPVRARTERLSLCKIFADHRSRSGTRDTEDRQLKLRRKCSGHKE